MDELSLETNLNAKPDEIEYKVIEKERDNRYLHLFHYSFKIFLDSDRKKGYT